MTGHRASGAGDVIWSVLLHAVTGALAAVYLVPFAWLICAAFKQSRDLYSVLFLPWDDLGRLTLDNFRRLFAEEPFATWLVNSIFVSSTHTVLVVTLSSLGGFALAKYQFAGKRILTVIMLATMLLPSQVLLPGNYEVMYHLGWLNSFAAILVPGAVSVFGVFLFREAFAAVPDELLQAGRIDGCSEIRLWWTVTLPIIQPTIAAYTLLSFLGSWNAFLWPQIVLQDEMRHTLPIGLANMMGTPQYQNDQGVLMAATLLGIVPVAVLFFALQRHFIAGLTSGAVKG